MRLSFKDANRPPPVNTMAAQPKRSISPPLIGLGVGAVLLGGFAWYGSRTTCTEGRVVENVAQCRSLVGFQYASLCDAAFAMNPATERLGVVVERAAFVTTRKDAQPGVENVVRDAGNPKWRSAFSNQIMEPYRQNCSSSRSGSGSGGSGSSASSSSGDGSGTHAVARGGFGGTGMGFFSRGG